MNNSSTTSPTLDKNLHLRVPLHFYQQLQEVASSYNMKKSTFARILLQRELVNYTKQKFWY